MFFMYLFNIGSACPFIKNYAKLVSVMKRQATKYKPPTLKDFLLVLLVFGLLVAFSWIAYFKLGWFH